MSLLSQIIRAETAASGVLPFARFMELALYCPDSGYYETKKDSPGRRGDFYTSVSAGELFGQLLAFQFAEWLGEARSANCGVRIVEAGAHDGTLAKDILNWLQSARPKLFGQIEYGIIEPSLSRQAWQKEALKHFAPRVRWFSRFNDSTLQRFNGVIFSNELLDAMPVHRFGWDATNKKWFEWGVALAGEKFVWARCSDSLAPQDGKRAGARGALENPPSSILHLLARQSGAETAPSSLLDVLPDGYIIETCPAAKNWWREAANVLKHGRLLTIDYGLTGDELFSPARTRGTLRAYFRHHATDDLLANVGEQDLTAHVNFSAIQSVGESCGLKTEALSTQAQFLTRILEKASKDKSLGELVASKLSEDGWGAKQARQFQTLTHPEHLGHAFRVLIQSR
jgi:SAM-dependent MidA family methyltransferase